MKITKAYAPPYSKEEAWVDLSENNKPLKVFLNGKWTTVGDTNEGSIQEMVIDYLSYGVSWKPGVADTALTRVGNMIYHKTLPIQNGMKGCVVKCKDSVEIQYYLDPNDWRFKADSAEKDTFTTGVTPIISTEDGSIIGYTITESTRGYFKSLHYEHQYLKLTSKNTGTTYIVQVASLDTTNGIATLKVGDDFPKTMSDYQKMGSVDVELGSVLNGYDGEVMVEVPEFWIRSWDTDTRREVRVSTFKVDSTWEHQPRVLIAAYKDSILREVPSNMGYLSTLAADSLVSICNTNAYCRGGSNDSDYDAYLETDSFYTDLGKPAGNLTYEYACTCHHTNLKEVMTYAKYKNILYWLYIIEYANFDCMLPFNAGLTSEGYHQGGLGEGVSTLKTMRGFFTPNGYTNELGNNTGIKAAYSSNYKQSQDVVRWHGIENPFGDGSSMLTGLSISFDNINATFYRYGEGSSPSRLLIGKMSGNDAAGGQYVKEWNLLNTAEIIPREFGDYTIKNKYRCSYLWHSYCKPMYLAVGFNQGGTAMESADSHRLGSLGRIYFYTPRYPTMGVRTSVVISD